MRAFAMVVLAALGGCQLSPEAKADDVAQEICACLDPGDRTCVATEVKALGTTVSDACAECVFDHEHTCASMLTDCSVLCTQQNPTPGGP